MIFYPNLKARLNCEVTYQPLNWRNSFHNIGFIYFLPVPITEILKYILFYSKQIERIILFTKFSVKPIYIKKYIKNINNMLLKMFTSSSHKIILSFFNLSFVDSILIIQNINSSETFWKGHKYCYFICIKQNLLFSTPLTFD